MMRYFPPRKRKDKARKFRNCPSDFFLVNALLNRHDKAVAKRSKPPKTEEFEEIQLVPERPDTPPLEANENEQLPAITTDPPSLDRNSSFKMISTTVVQCVGENGQSYNVSLAQFGEMMSIAEDEDSSFSSFDDISEDSFDFWFDEPNSEVADVTSFLGTYFGGGPETTQSKTKTK